MTEPDFEKGGGLVPAIVQDARTREVLMLGYMNREAYGKTLREKKVTFFSRSRQTLWTKGETSGNFLHLQEVKTDCDADTLLVLAVPEGPVCHTGSDTCFGDAGGGEILFLEKLEKLIGERKQQMPDNSYTTKLFRGGAPKIAQKVGEEAVELVIEAMRGEYRAELFLGEAADLLYHFLVLLAEKGSSLKEVAGELEKRHRPDSPGGTR